MRRPPLDPAAGAPPAAPPGANAAAAARPGAVPVVADPERRRRVRARCRAIWAGIGLVFFYFFPINRGGQGATASVNHPLTVTFQPWRLSLPATESQKFPSRIRIL
jgi:hypothetical protein